MMRIGSNPDDINSFKAILKNQLIFLSLCYLFSLMQFHGTEIVLQLLEKF